MDNRKRAHRVIALLTRDQVDFLDQVGKDALFSTGRKLSRTKIISALVEFLRNLGIDGRGVRGIEDLKEKIYARIRWSSVEATPTKEILIGRKGHDGKSQLHSP